MGWEDQKMYCSSRKEDKNRLYKSFVQNYMFVL